MVMVIIENVETEVDGRVHRSLLSDDPTPFQFVQEAIAIEASIEPRLDQILREALHHKAGMTSGKQISSAMTTRRVARAMGLS